MKRATAVIGSTFGDEGKGLMVDYFCRQAKDLPIVVRYNGGAQAGHTVVTASGERHVFHHFGAGTLAGAQTYLSKYFLVNPHLWWKESCELAPKIERIPDLLIHPEAPVTTIYDMFVNQKIEESRTNRHGSCGTGIHETMRRQDIAPLEAFHLLSPTTTTTLLQAIREHALVRLANLNLLTDANAAWINRKDIFDRFIQECIKFRLHCIFVDDNQLQVYKNVIFEGAQGLLLDQDNGRFFPHVTHSKTGLKNIFEIAVNAKIDVIDAVYVCRSYLTRHGAGELPNEDVALSFEDTTNVSNAWQGSLRFAPQDWRLISDAIKDDLSQFSPTGHVAVLPTLAITHLDQCANVGKVCIPTKYESYGPTAGHVRDIVECLKPATNSAA